MDQKWIQILAILVFYQKMTSGAGEDITVKEGQSVDINCVPSEKGTMIVWFRVLENSGLEFIASFSTYGILKSMSANIPSTFNHDKISQNILTLASFNKARDSGTYSCAGLYKGNELKFGKVTRLAGEKVAIISAPVTTAAKPDPCTTAQPCFCKTNYTTEEPSLFSFCTLLLIPLAGGCGLLLLLLIFTIVCCNKMRTRRCPHHHKRKPRMMPPEKMMMTNRHA
ncbi:T-cell surface glycoprotein CD8 alpha chain [Pempheris klunzingeri]|uniref:T-cell surface glycoprotein CD8 alpha chain n=1 Tax=Pempheris klunzingeri TaxID=3127111 RepID=UPI0039816197